ncbi:MAG TPA: Crp/Fnr family transcriptional regulator [Acidimicrobiales bacterium]
MEQLLDLTAGLPERVLAAGESLVHAGEEADHIYVLLEGRLVVRRDGEDLLAFDEPGSCIGEKALLLDQAHHSSVVASERSRVRVVEDAASSLHDNPALLFAVAVLLARRLEMVEAYLGDLKHQYRDHEGGLGMIGEVLTTLTSHHGQPLTPGSEREPDPLY